MSCNSRGLLRKTFTGEITLVKFENSGKHDFTIIDFAIGKKNLVKITRVFSPRKVLCNRPLVFGKLLLKFVLHLKINFHAVQKK